MEFELWGLYGRGSAHREGGVAHTIFGFHRAVEKGTESVGCAKEGRCQRCFFFDFRDGFFTAGSWGAVEGLGAMLAAVEATSGVEGGIEEGA
jgi:hypothetical protein